MTKRTIIVCFDNGNWIQKNIEYDETDNTDDILIHRYIENYIDKKNCHPLLEEMAPSIIYIKFID